MVNRKGLNKILSFIYLPFLQYIIHKIIYKNNHFTNGSFCSKSGWLFTDLQNRFTTKPKTFLNEFLFLQLNDRRSV